MRHATHLGLSLAALLAFTFSTSAQVDPPDQIEVDLRVDSGLVSPSAAGRGVIFSTVVSVPDVSWLRLRFDEAKLGASPARGERTVLRITSLRDAGVQTLNATHLGQWQNTSAYFNGSALLLQIIADAGAGASRILITGAWAGPPEPTGARTICGPNDDRVLSDDPRVGRSYPTGCTAWIINDWNRCFLTAGHCIGDSFQIIEFNVPLSNGNGGINHPSPEDQYAVDELSIQTNYGQGVGDDWAYFGCFANTETGLTPYEAQGEYFVLAMPPPVEGQSIRITGCGTTEPPVPNEWNKVQKTHVGPFVTSNNTTVEYETDTTGGNSGSPVILEETGEAIGIHTHGGCTEVSGQNSGTGANHPGLQYALEHPQGVCIPNLPLAFSFPDGLPESIDPAGDSIRVVVAGDNGGEPAPGTGLLYYDSGEGFITVEMVEVADNVYDAVFPPLDCPSGVDYYFSAETTDGDVIFDPFNAPIDWYDVFVAVEIDYIFADDFETDTGWYVVNSPELTDGAWERGVPAGGGDRGDPPYDADGSGQCYVTDNADDNSDVDGGSTTLYSPLMDASDGGAMISYYRWYSNSTGSDPENDIFEVDVTDNDGQDWVSLEVVGPSGPEVNGGWYHKEFRVADVPGIVNSDLFRIRFTASDLGDGSVVEAGVDGVILRVLRCEQEQIPGDIDGDGDVDTADLLALLAAWGPCPDCPEDINGDGVVNTTDLLTLLANWGP